MSPSLPPPPPRRPPAAVPQHLAQAIAKNETRSRKIRPLVYAIGIAGIVGSGALIGAMLKMDREQKQAQKQSRARSTASPNPSGQAGTAVQAHQSTVDIESYNRSIATLEAKRGTLFGQKVALERKIKEFQESQLRKEQEEHERKNYGMKR